MIFRARQFEFVFPRPALVMGVVNVTPDSFSDGGQFLEPAAAIAHGEALVAEGADIIDVGGESTRPGAAPVDEKEELRRVIPVISALAGRLKVPVSIDTMKPGVARAALDAGASIVNDVAANRKEDEMWRLVAGVGAGYVAVHMRGDPATMHMHPVYDDVTREVESFFSERLKRLNDSGIAAAQIVLDPGIGFGKTLEHNLQLLAGLGRFTRMGRPVMLGVSRKSFIGKLSGCSENERLPGALACTVLAAEAGVQMFRTHDVAETAGALRVTGAIMARR